MPANPPKYTVRCEPNCSLDESKIGVGPAAALLALRNSGLTGRPFARQASVIVGYEIPSTNAVRHVRHYRELETGEAPPPEPGEPGHKVSDLQILDDIISAGARNSRSWKPTIKDTLDAMKLKMQLTGNSAFEDMLSMMDSALDLADDADAVPETPDALGTVDERPEPDEELAEPLIG